MKNKKFAITAIVVLLAVVASVSGWLFMLSKMYEKNFAIMSLRKSLLENERKIMEAKALNSLVASVKSDMAVVDSVFLTEKDLLRVIQGLESIGRSSGANLKISSVTAGEGSAKPVFNFSATGSFEQLFEYFYFLENIPYLIIIDKISFQKTESGDNKIKNLWQANFDVELEGYENS